MRDISMLEESWNERNKGRSRFRGGLSAAVKDNTKNPSILRSNIYSSEFNDDDEFMKSIGINTPSIRSRAHQEQNKNDEKRDGGSAYARLRGLIMRSQHRFLTKLRSRHDTSSPPQTKSTDCSVLFRALFILFILGGMLYTEISYDHNLELDRKESHKKAKAYHHQSMNTDTGDNYFDEGVDRPVSGNLFIRKQADKVRYLASTIKKRKDLQKTASHTVSNSKSEVGSTLDSNEFVIRDGLQQEQNKTTDHVKVSAWAAAKKKMKDVTSKLENIHSNSKHVSDADTGASASLEAHAGEEQREMLQEPNQSHKKEFTLDSSSQTAEKVLQYAEKSSEFDKFSHGKDIVTKPLTKNRKNASAGEGNKFTAHQQDKTIKISNTKDIQHSSTNDNTLSGALSNVFDNVANNSRLPVDETEKEKSGLPTSFNNLADFSTYRHMSDIPVFWHIPKAGGTTIKAIFGSCLQFTMACEVGQRKEYSDNSPLAVIEADGHKYANVDTTTPRGIAVAKSLNLAESGIADIIVTNYVHEISDLFTKERKGRIFTMLRDPIDRAVSMFGYLQYADWEPGHTSKLASMSIDEYARSNMVENNWMTRFLSGHMSGELTSEDLIKAKAVLREKFLIGILDYKEESWSRIQAYYGLEVSSRTTPHRWECIQRQLKTGSNINHFSKSKITPGSETHSLLLWQNKFDMQLYSFGKEIFNNQGNHIKNVAAIQAKVKASTGS